MYKSVGRLAPWDGKMPSDEPTRLPSPTVDRCTGRDKAPKPVAMNVRLENFMWRTAVYSWTVATAHSFCNKHTPTE